MRQDARKLIGVCGIFCGTCPIYCAYKKGDVQQLDEISQAFGIPIEDVGCDGCLSDKVFPPCVECRYGFRQCASEKKVKWCFECHDFPCQRLSDFASVHLADSISHYTNLLEDFLLPKPREKLKIASQGALPTSARQKPLTPLEERFIKSGFEGFSDEERIELLLGIYLPHRKCKTLAKECIEQFNNLRGFLAASPQELQRIGLTPHCICGIKLLRELPTEILKQKIMERPVHKSSKEVFDYLYYSMRDLKKEVFKVIYLNMRHQIVDTVDLFEGTLDSIRISPRQIMESTIKSNAAALIFVHNHPSGDPTPSRGDKQLTRDLVFMGNILQIKVLDHIIIGENRYFSFADEGLIEKYEDNFLNLKIRGVLDIRLRFKKLAKVSAPLN